METFARRVDKVIFSSKLFHGAEGSGSSSKREFSNFLNIARRSTFENANVILVLEKRSLVDSATATEILQRLDHLCRKITNFQRSLGT